MFIIYGLMINLLNMLELTIMGGVDGPNIPFPDTEDSSN